MAIDKKKHIAVLSTMYYPDMGAPSAFIDKYVKALKENYIFHIITKTEVLDFTPSKDYDVRYITSFRHSLILKIRKQISEGKNVLLNKMVMYGINFCKLIQTQYAFPSAQRWEVDAYRSELEKLHDEVGLDTIIAVSNNWVTQLATMDFKRKHSDVKWIAFILDPYFFFHIYYKFKLFRSFWKRLNRKKEQEVFDEADYCMLSPEMYKNVPMYFRVNREHYFEIKFSLSILECNKEIKQENRTDGICNLIFAGMFYKKIRNPEFALQTLSKVQGIKLDLFVGRGECETILNKYNHGHIKRELFAERDRYVEMICNEYDVLVNVGNVSTLQAPSKMLELLSTGKPILNFYFTQDYQYEMIEKYPLGLNIGYQEEGAVEKIEKFCKEVKGKSIPYNEVEKLFPENRLEAQVALLKKLIES